MQINKLNKLLIIAGTGRNSGKTTLASTIIKRFSNIKPIAVKISPHFHDASGGLELLNINNDYNIYREMSESGDKDSSRMLISGSSEAYYIQVYDNNAGEAFNWLMNYLDTDKAIICESPALRRYIEPGVFIIADSEKISRKKDLSAIYDKADMVFMLGRSYDSLELAFSNGEWVLS